MNYVTIPIMKAASEQDIEALAAKQEPAIAKAVLKALDDQAGQIDLDALAEALTAGDINKVMDMLQISAKGLAAVAGEAQGAAWAGGALAATQVTRIGGTMFVFDKLNPKLIDWLQTYSLNLIRQIDAGTKEGIREALVRGMNAGIGPRQQAKQIKAIVGLTRRQTNAVLNFRKELETFHHRRKAAAWNLGAKIDRVNGAQVLRPDENGDPKDKIMERRLRDFRHDAQLKRAMDTSKPLKPEQIDKMVEAYARKYRKYRAETIARTEAMRATNVGLHEGWRQAIMQGDITETLVRRFWKVAKDERQCEVCGAVPGMNAKGVEFGKPFATPQGPVMMGPLHPDCRCHVFIRVMEPIELGLAGP